jgi:hypothetical protein
MFIQIGSTPSIDKEVRQKLGMVMTSRNASCRIPQASMNSPRASIATQIATQLSGTGWQPTA